MSVVSLHIESTDSMILFLLMPVSEDSYTDQVQWMVYRSHSCIGSGHTVVLDNQLHCVTSTVLHK